MPSKIVNDVNSILTKQNLLEGKDFSNNDWFISVIKENFCFIRSNKHNFLDGLVIDYERKHILNNTPNPKKININDKNSGNFYEYIEGEIVNIMRYMGETYYFNGKNFDFSYKEIIENLGGPSDNDLFSNMTCSNICYMFLLKNRNELYFYNKLFTGTFKGDDNNSFELDIHKFPKVKFMNGIDYNFIETYLKYGDEMEYSEFLENEKNFNLIDKRLMPSKTILWISENGRETGKISNEAILWRNSILENNPDINGQYFKLIDKAINLSKDNKKLLKYFVLFPSLENKYCFDDLDCERLFLIPTLNEPSEKKYTRNEIINLVWINIFFTLPLERRHSILNYQDNLFDSIKNFLILIDSVTELNEITGEKVFSKNFYKKRKIISRKTFDIINFIRVNRDYIYELSFVQLGDFLFVILILLLENPNYF